MLDEKQFKNPPVEYRNIPLWVWTDQLCDERLASQIQAMHEQGWGGFFMHPRTGLYTPYLTREWMDKVRVCVKEAGKRGMQAWLYDEDRWPSGFAGGTVVAENPHLSQRNLVCQLGVPDRSEVHKLLAVYRARVDGDSVKEAELVASGDDDNALWEAARKLQDGLEESSEACLVIFDQLQSHGLRWFNGYCYPDLLNPASTESFLKQTHEKYAEAVGDEFGETIPGIFTDEPCIRYRIAAPENSLHWTEGFANTFQERYGYDLREHLISLFYDLGDWAAVRYDYWRLSSELFVQNYTKKLYEWCTEHHLMLTGHMMAEDTIDTQIEWSGSIMPHYEYFDIPGVDHLGFEIGHMLTFRQVASVASQLGKQRVFCEIFGGSGQGLTLRDMKWMADWALVHGINFFDTHISLYSLRGIRKYDYPPNIAWQQPYWPHMHLFSDYVARASYVLSQGQRIADVLVIHPLESGWIDFCPGDRFRSRRWSEMLNQVMRQIIQAGYDFELGDESLLARYAKVENGRLQVGQQSYRVVVVPPTKTLRPETRSLLEAARKAGIEVAVIGQTPGYINGRPAESGELSIPGDCIDLSDLDGWLIDRLGRLRWEVRVLQGSRTDLGVHARDVDGQKVFFLANHGREVPLKVRVIYRHNPAGISFESWDPADGSCIRLREVKESGNSVSADLTIPPVGSRLLMIRARSEAGGSGNRREAAPVDVPVLKDKGKRVFHLPVGIRSPEYQLSALPGMWKLELADPNALVLDMCQYRIGKDQAWSPVLPVIEAWRDIGEAGADSFAIRHVFNVRSVPETSFLVIENANDYVIRVNGQLVDQSTIRDWWRDPAWKMLPVTEYLRQGENEIVYEGTFRDEWQLHKLFFGHHLGKISSPRPSNKHYGPPTTELDNAFLLGSFGVYPNGKASWVVESRPEWVNWNDLVLQGLPFYAGTVRLRGQVTIPEFAPSKKVLVGLEQVNAAAVTLKVDGRNAGTVAWEPWAWDITELVRPGQVASFEFSLCNTLRNLLGPNHHPQGELGFVSPQDFGFQNGWVEDYRFIPFGIGDGWIIIE